jgi:prepilin signal peptidase PulO-like enzyme (type II secretory pathway)
MVGGGSGAIWWQAAVCCSRGHPLPPLTMMPSHNTQTLSISCCCCLPEWKTQYHLFSPLTGSLAAAYQTPPLLSSAVCAVPRCYVAAPVGRREHFPELAGMRLLEAARQALRVTVLLADR